MISLLIALPQIVQRLNSKNVMGRLLGQVVVVFVATLQGINPKSDSNSSVAT